MSSIQATSPVIFRQHFNRTLTRLARPAVKRLPVRFLRRIPVVGTVSVRVPGFKQPVRMTSEGHDPIASMLYWHGSIGWEPETIQACLRLLAPGSTIVDVGANTGYVSLCLALGDPRVRVEAFEPVPRVFAQLEANRALNSAGNLICHQLALSDQAGAVEFYIPNEPVPVMASMLSTWRPDAERVVVEATTLDQVIAARADVWPVQLIKIDTEGTEDRVLNGAETVIARDRPFVVCEVLPVSGTSKRLEVFFSTRGYEFLQLRPEGPRRCTNLSGASQECRNYLFVHTSRSIELSGLLEGIS